MQHGHYCNSLWCSEHFHGSRFGFGFFLIRLLFALVVVLVVFWLGVKVGEVKTFTRSGYGNRTMYYQGMGKMGTPFPPRMMRVQNGTQPDMQPQSTTTPLNK